jgi:type 1 fimbriae regulatory protein FimE
MIIYGNIIIQQYNNIKDLMKLNTKNQTTNTAKLPPKKQKNVDLRSREYLLEHEIEQLRKSARQQGRHGHRNDTLIFIMFRHGLRVSEAIALHWEQIDLKKGLMHVKRIKNGIPSTHPIRGSELRALRKLLRDYEESSYVFTTERNAPLSGRTVRYIISEAGKNAGFKFTIHPHMLRHSTGFYLASKGHDTRAIQSYLGHSNINNTVIYTHLSPQRFNNFWDD